MAARVNYQSLQNSLSLLSPLYFINHNSKFAPRFKNRLHFRQNLFSSSSSSSLRSGAAMFCTCSSNSNSNREIESAAEPFVLTTPLYYVNAPPHMGSAYTTIAADAIARFQRLLGKRVIFITGTDEHGEKIATAAAAGGSSPSEHCDTISQAYKTLWKDVVSLLWGFNTPYYTY